MIRPSQAWCLQIDVTNACHLHCSNCTRVLDHARTRYFMTVDEFRKAVDAVKDFIPNGEKDPQGRGKVIGIIGGEPLLHPEFPALVDVLVERVPDAVNRGLWTSKDWKRESHPKYGPYRPHVERLVGPHETNGRAGGQGWLNWNMHHGRIEHQPVLTASKDLIPDEKMRWELIEDCWLQRSWSPTVTPKGFYFCEVAGALEMVLGGSTGLPLDPGVWEGDLHFERDEHGVPRPKGKFADQIRAACERCGVCVPLPGRVDTEETDDVSLSNLQTLSEIASPRFRKGKIKVIQGPVEINRQGWNPRQYRKGC